MMQRTTNRLSDNALTPLAMQRQAIWLMPEGMEETGESRSSAGESQAATHASRGPAGDPERLLRVQNAPMVQSEAGQTALILLLGQVANGAVDGSPFRWIWLAAAVISMIAVGFIRGRALAVETRVDRVDVRAILPQAVVIWALAEGQALLALVGYFLTGDLALLVVGLVLFIFLLGRHRPGSFLKSS